jgi:Glycosyl transferase family group 2
MPESAVCVANAPGGPVHVLSSNEIAEHIPGCNMAYRRDRLIAIGGFDARFRVAGDDVDVCWRLQECGWTLGFAPAALVWHHRRNSIRSYFKQQKGYAKAEALLAEKWPSKYNSIGHLMWQGRLYGRGVVEALFPSPRIYHGVWGTAPYQSIYEPSPGLLPSLPLMPEWYFLLGGLVFLVMLGLSWAPLLRFLPLLVIGVTLTLIQAIRAGKKASFHPRPSSRARLVGSRAMVSLFHLVQPAARLLGRIQQGMGPWSWKGFGTIIPLPHVQTLWSERWESMESRLAQIEQILHNSGSPTIRGGDFDEWDLTIHGGLFGSMRILGMVE